MNDPCGTRDSNEYSRDPAGIDASRADISRVLHAVRARIAAAAGSRSESVQLVAVSKTQPADALRAAFAAGQRAFGENYLQEARAKQAQLQDLVIEWHFIGALQSNKCAEVARHFDWVQTVDRAKLAPLLAQHRRPDQTPLNVLIQVNIDAESSKAGVVPDAVAALARNIDALPSLRLRGLMAIPAPHPDPGQRRASFARLKALFDALRIDHPEVDTLSMGMSEDYELAIAEGATMVRIGSRVFGDRPTVMVRGHP